MKFDASQRRFYLLSLIVLMVAIALVCIWRLYLAGDEEETPRLAASEEKDISTVYPLVPILSPAPASEDQTASGNVNTVVYYQDNYGYLVPVMNAMPLQDGIAKATLEKMIHSSENDMQAARLGLRTVIPENAKIDLDIHDGRARIDLSKEATKLADATAESNMITAIVQTLTEFDTVKSVEFLFGGQKLEKLPHGTDVSGVFTRGDLNLETVSVPTSASGEASKLTLYFPGESASVVVPVTRIVYSQPDLDTAVLEMTKGPRSDALEEVIPKGCGLIDVKLENRVAKLNFTREFMQIVHNVDGGRLALKALIVTCTQFEGVDKVEIYVEGEKWDTGEGTLAVPSFSNLAADVEQSAIQAQSEAIFGDE